jgi:hypothetical protein
MDKRGKKKKRMKNNVCVYSGKPIGSRDCVLVENAVAYLRSKGHLVSNKIFEEDY